MTEDTHPSFADLIKVGSRRFEAARTLDERRSIQRDHLAAIAATLAELTLLDAGADPGIPPDDAKRILLNGLVFVTVNTAILLQAHGFGEPLLPEDECADLAHDTYQDRLRVLLIAGHSGGEA